jgi:hypothetical protein
VSTVPTLNGFTAASTIHKWLRQAHGRVISTIDLDEVRTGLPGSPLGKEVRIIKEPMPFAATGFEGILARNPEDPSEWGILYHPDAGIERRRFTIAHELGHFVLHRAKKLSFKCDKESVHLGLDQSANIEREADEFASNLLMPGDVLRDLLADRKINLRVLSEVAQTFGVSFEALCIRFIKYTPLRAILIHWDNGFLKYEWRSSSAVKTRARIRRVSDPAEPLRGTVAADSDVVQDWDGTVIPASLWCMEEPAHMRLTEFKHSFTARERVMSLLILEGAEPRAWDNTWHDEQVSDSFDNFIANGQPPLR